MMRSQQTGADASYGVVDFVALRQNKPAQSGRCEWNARAFLPIHAPLCAARQLAARAVPPLRRFARTKQ